MRERKYKVWDKLHEEWLDLEKDYFIRFSGGKLEVIQVDKYWSSVLEHVEIVEYTGLNDKNSKEIYEGDIIQSQLDKKIVGVVTYGKYAGHTGFHVNWKGGIHKELLHRELAYWTLISEVIGNVYENQELLECKVNL